MRNCKQADCQKYDMSICKCAECACKKCNCKKDIQKPRSTWDIYLQILGLDQIKDLDQTLKLLDNQEKNTDRRKIQLFLKDNKLIHPLAIASFPDRQGIEKIIRKEQDNISNERVRKILILLSFYEFWVKKALNKKSEPYVADGEDADRCNSRINKFLIEAGYPKLYAGNPYDWIFLHSAFQKEPLATFRAFIQELYLLKEDELVSKA